MSRRSCPRCGSRDATYSDLLRREPQSPLGGLGVLAVHALSSVPTPGELLMNRSIAFSVVPDPACLSTNARSNLVVPEAAEREQIAGDDVGGVGAAAALGGFGHGREHARVAQELGDHLRQVLGA